MPRGGARPGAGRKRKDTREQQLANRQVLLATVHGDALREMVLAQVANAKRGDPKAFLAIAPYLLGSPTQEIEVTGAEGGPVHFSLHLGDAEPTD